MLTKIRVEVLGAVSLILIMYTLLAKWKKRQFLGNRFMTILNPAGAQTRQKYKKYSHKHDKDTGNTHTTMTKVQEILTQP